MVLVPSSSDAISVTILGATGSIGTQTIEALTRASKSFSIESLVAYQNADALIQMAIKYLPKRVVLFDETRYETLKTSLLPYGIVVEVGRKAVESAATTSDIVVSALTGALGIEPTMAALQAGKKLLLANKESLVCAGKLMMQAATNSQAEIIPIDSEHNAIFLLLAGQEKSALSHITITASGGPFWQRPLEELSKISVQEACNHPVWPMGNKISIDSATMMNKGLEFIEAHYLFGIEANKINLVIHPESMIHGMIQWQDGMLTAVINPPDMVFPIHMALMWPDRGRIEKPFVDIAAIAQMNFHPLDEERFRAVYLAKQSLKEGKALSVVYNTVNEVAVNAFLQGKIAFDRIIPMVEEAMMRSHYHEPQSIQEVLDIRDELYVQALSVIS